MKTVGTKRCQTYKGILCVQRKRDHLSVWMANANHWVGLIGSNGLAYCGLGPKLQKPNMKMMATCHNYTCWPVYVFLCTCHWYMRPGKPWLARIICFLDLFRWTRSHKTASPHSGFKIIAVDRAKMAKQKKAAEQKAVNNHKSVTHTKRSNGWTLISALPRLVNPGLPFQKGFVISKIM